jgi:hypothetical protein
MSMGLTSKRSLWRSSLLGLLLAAAGWGAGAQTTLVMASTTSTEQSGLFGHLLPAFKAATGLEVKVVALGTGQALDMGRRGDADVLFMQGMAAVHAGNLDYAITLLRRGIASGLAHSEDSLNGYPGSSSWNESWHRRHGHPARSQSP